MNFSAEAITALAILALISSSVLVVINRCLESVGDSVLRMQALEVARDNMEQLLSSASVKETTEFGESDKYPDIKWQTAIESFYEPITSRMWIRGVCSAEYQDSKGEPQKIELTHWLTDLTKDQLLQMTKEKEMQQAKLAGQIMGTIEEAAEYAGVDVETVEEWVDNGMLKMEDGSFVKDNIDLYNQNQGRPSEEVKTQQIKSEQELQQLQRQGQIDGKDNPFKDFHPENMTMEEIMEFIQRVFGGGT